MSKHQRGFLGLNVVGGIAVLASYVLWLGNPSNDAGALWGSIPDGGRTIYTVSMFAAAAGYFLFFPYLLRDCGGVEADERWARFTRIIALVLFPSSWWMPPTYEYLDAPSPALWWAMRLTLFTVGGASLTLLAAIVCDRRQASPLAHRLAVIGAVLFCIQTAVLDAFVWPLFFPR